MEKIVILTGAGISAESGLGTFRDEGGLWAQHRIEDVATPEGFARDPALVHGFYNARRVQAAEAQPNAAHNALARLQRDWPGEVVIITQNVDSLHEAGGAQGVIHMHGTLAGALCAACGHRWTAPPEMAVGEPCPACAAPTARPDVVWFGEMPYHMDAIYDHLAGASDLRRHWHFGSGLSRRGLRARGHDVRGKNCRTEPRAVDRRIQFRRSHTGPRNRNRSALG